MSTLTAVYDGKAFVPVNPCDIRKGAVVKLSILDSESAASKTSRLHDFQRLTEEFQELNRNEPLGAKFDEILSRRVDISREIDL